MGESQKNKNLGNSKSSGAGKPKKKLDDNAKFKKNSITVLIAIAVVLAVSVAIKSNIIYNKFAAVKIGGYSFSAADYNFQFNTALYQTYSNITAYYGESATSLLDPNKALDQQKYSDTQTWADYFKELALSNLQQTAILLDGAKSVSLKLSDDTKKEIETVIDGYKKTYKSSGFASLNAFLEYNFGKGMTESVFRKNLENQYLASNYKKQLDSKTYTNDELETFYSKNKDSLDAITYRQYFVTAATDLEGGKSSDAALEAAKATAEKIAAAKSEDGFVNLVYQNAPSDQKDIYAKASATLNNAQRSSTFSNITSAWLLDPSRKQGDTTVAKADTGYFAVYFINRSDNKYNVKKVRHILISVSDFKDTAKADEALKKANSLLDTFKSGDKTETSFANLAKENSSDDSSDGGYYEVYRGQMVPEFENWSFDSSRKAGDTGVIKSDYGYHIMYFIGDGDQYRYVLAAQDKRVSDYNVWFENQKKAMTINQTYFMRFARQS